MIKTYKVLSILLSYPDQELQEFLPEVLAVLNEEAMLKPEVIIDIGQFVETFSNTALLEWQEQYVQLFDFSRSVSLHLFEHVHGDSLDRGQAMVDLTEEYAKTGLQLQSGELPDYLPVFLEYLSMLTTQQAAGLLAEAIHIIAAIHVRLKEKLQAYTPLFAALMSLSDKTAEDAAVDAIMQNQKKIDFDMEYNEEPVTFGGSKNPCISCKQ